MRAYQKQHTGNLSRARETALAWALARLAPRRAIAALLNSLVRHNSGLPLADALAAAMRARARPGARRNAGAALALDLAEGRFETCRDRAVQRDDATGEDPLDFMRAAGQPWPLNSVRPQPARGLTASACLVLFTGADARAALPWLEPGCAGELIAHDGVSNALALKAVHPGLNLRERRETQRGFSLPWYAQARRYAGDIVAAAARASDAPAPGAAIARHAAALANKLNLDLIREINAAEILTEELRPWRGRQIMLVEGAAAVEHLAQALAADGHDPAAIFLLCSSCKPTARLAFAQRRSQPAPAAAAAHDNGAALAAAAASFRKRVSIPASGGAGVISADFRDRSDFRYLATAYAMIEALAQKRRVLVLQPFNSLNTNLLRIWRRIAFRRFGRVQLAFLHSPHAFRLDATAQLCAEFFAALAHEAPLPQTGLAPQGLSRVCVAVLRQFGAHYAPQALAIASAVEAAFVRQPPAYAIFIPDSQPFAMAAASGARAAGIPTLAVQTLMIGHSERDCLPICEYLACIDTSQRDLYEQRLGVPAQKMLQVGYAEMRDWFELAALHRAAPRSQALKRAIFITQPLPGIVDEALRWSVAAVAGLQDHELLIYAHPGETAAALARYDAIVASCGAADRVRMAGSGTPAHAVFDADVVINVVSNIGYKAALLGKPLISADPTADGLPVRFDEMGIALRAHDAASMLECLRALAGRGAAAVTLDRTRAAYLDANPQLTDGRTVARISEFVEKLAAGPAQGDIR